MRPRPRVGFPEGAIVPIADRGGPVSAISMTEADIFKLLEVSRVSSCVATRRPRLRGAQFSTNWRSRRLQASASANLEIRNSSNYRPGSAPIASLSALTTDSASAPASPAPNLMLRPS